jgi:hypothetical protein
MLQDAGGQKVDRWSYQRANDQRRRLLRAIHRPIGVLGRDASIYSTTGLGPRRRR